jgi:protein SCO1/2
MNLSKHLVIIANIVAISIISSCKADFEVIENLENCSYKLWDSDSNKVVFPELLGENIGVIGYIFTNCPDICPLTTNNMRLVQDKLKEENIEGVQFISISFDPEVDKPSVLKDFTKIRNLDLSNWKFLTSDKQNVDSLLKKVGVVAFVGDSTVWENGKKTYYYTHTDRIQLMDQEGRIRKNYLGSSLNVDEIVYDIKLLLD